MKRKLSLVLVAALISSLCIGCSSQKPAPDQATTVAAPSAAEAPADTATSGESESETTAAASTGNDQIVFRTVYSKNVLAMPIADMKVVKDVQEISGIKLEVIEIPSDGFGEKKNLMLASGDIPDIFMQGVGVEDIQKYRDQNIFKPITSLIDTNMPNLAKILNDKPEYKAAMVDPTGEIWGWPYIEEMFGLVCNQGILSINQKWCESLGIPLPTTMDEYKAMLVAFRDNDANGNGDATDEIPLMMRIGESSYGNCWRNNQSPGQFFGMWGQADTGNRLALNGDKVICTATTDAYKEGLKWFNELWKEGLIDKEMPLNDGAAYQAKMNTPDATVGSLMFFAIRDAVSADRRSEYTTIPYLQGPKGKFGVKDNISEMHQVVSGAITTACKYPDKAAGLVDLFFEPERSVESNWGEIGMYYEKDSQGVMRWVPEIPDGFDSYSQLRVYCTPTRPSIVLKEYYDTVVEYPKDAQDLYDDMIKSGFVKEHLADPIIPPNMWYDQADQDELALICPQIYNIIDNYNATAITDGNIDATWDKYLADLEAAGLSRYLEIVQKTYNAYNLLLDTFVAGVQ